MSQAGSSSPSSSDPVCLGLLEVFGVTPAMAALDAMEKSARVRLVQIELNDMLGMVLKIVGDVAAVRAAIDSGVAIAERMQGRPVSDVIPRPQEALWAIVDGPVEFNPLIQQNVVARPSTASASYFPIPRTTTTTSSSSTASEEGADMAQSAQQPSNPPALGFIETQGFTAVFEAIDTACKAARVEVVGKEKLGGGYITVVIQGDVAAVNAAIESGRAKVEGLGKLIAAHVIARPSPSVLGLLPK